MSLPQAPAACGLLMIRPYAACGKLLERANCPVEMESHPEV